MKKLNFLFGALLLASTSVFTSCFSNDIPSIVINPSQGPTNRENDGVSIAQITQSSNYAYTIQCNVAADIRVGKSYESVQKVSSTSSYTGKGGVGEKIYIMATTSVPGYTTEPVKKTVTLDANGKVVTITFAKNPSEATSVDANRKYAISLNEAKEKTADGREISIENTEVNKKEPYPNGKTDVHMYITNPMTVNALNAGTPGEALYTITAKEAVMSGVNQDLNEGPEWFPVLGLMCKPDGAQFGSSPARVVVNSPYFEKGMNFRCVGAVDNKVILDANGGSVSMKFPHFSDYIIESEVTVEKIGIDSIKTQTLLDCKVGNLTYTYFVYSGCDYDYHANEFMNKYLEAKFGKKKFESKGEFTVSNLSSRATIPYTITQAVHKYKVTFGDIPILVNVYGKEDLYVDTTKAVIYDATKHSGGSGF